MTYPKGRQSRSSIIAAAWQAARDRGFAGVTMGDLSAAAGATTGKMTHHFPSKASLFDAVTLHLFDGFEAKLLPILRDATGSPEARISEFLDGLLRSYAQQTGMIGCPIGLIALDPVGTTELMRDKALQAVLDTQAGIERALRAMGRSRAEAKAGALLFVSTWQGAVLIARAGRGLPHIRATFAALKAQLAVSPVASATANQPALNTRRKTISKQTANEALRPRRS